MTAGYNASAGPPEGTTVAAGYCNNVGVLGGRPEGTTLDRGYEVGRSYKYSYHVDFTGCDTPIDCDSTL